MSVQFNDFSVQVQDAMNNAILNFLEEAGGEVEARAVRNSRVDTSHLKSSWEHVVDEGERSVSIGSTDKNAIWEEFGTGEYALEGKGRREPWYVPFEKFMGHHPPTFNGKVVIVEDKATGKKWYKTNGKKPNRTLQRAIDSSKNAIKNRARQIGDELR